MSIRRTVWLSIFLATVSLSVADASRAAWPTKEANRCWGMFNSDGSQVPGASVVLHIVPLGGKTAVVTGKFTREGFFIGPVSGIAAIQGDVVDVLVDLGGYDPKPTNNFYWQFNRSTLEMGNVLKQVSCRSLAQ